MRPAKSQKGELEGAWRGVKPGGPWTEAEDVSGPPLAFSRAAPSWPCNGPWSGPGFPGPCGYPTGPSPALPAPEATARHPQNPR